MNDFPFIPTACHVEVSKNTATKRPAASIQVIVDGHRLTLTPNVESFVSAAPEVSPREVSWGTLAMALRPTTVVDNLILTRNSELPASLTHLYPLLAPGGTYILENLPAEGPLRDIIQTLHNHSEGSPVAIDSDFLSYCRRVTASVHVDGTSATLRKHEFEQRVLHARPLRELTWTCRTAVPAATYRRRRPILSVTTSMEASLRRLTGDYGDVMAPAARFAVLDNAKVIGYGTIILDERWVVRESMAHSHHRQQRGLLFQVGNTDTFVTERHLEAPPSNDPIDGPCIVLKQTWDANYGHWLIDTFSRLAAIMPYVDIREAKILLNRAPNGAMQDVFRDSLALLGVSDDQIIVDGTHPRDVRTALYATPLTRAPLIKHPAAIDFLRQLTAHPLVEEAVNYAPSGKLYISRNRYGKRQLLNEDAILEPLLRAGYAVVHPEQLTLYEQIATFSRATHIIGNMGAAFSNLAFSPEGAKVMCLGTELMQHDYFYDISCLRNGLYVGVQGEANAPASGLASDFTIDEKSFTSLAVAHGFL